MAEETKEETREDLSKRGKKDGVYRSGSFKKAKKKGYKVVGLNKKQIKRGKAGGKKVTKNQASAAQSNTVNISDTRFVKGEGVKVGDKLFTGNVKLASGKTAHYVNGRRVMSGGPKGGNRSRSGSRSGSGGGSGGGGSRTGQSSSAANLGGASKEDYKSEQGNNKKITTIIGVNKPLTPGEAPGRFQSKSRPSGRQVGDIRSVPYGTGKLTRKQKWDGSKWVPIGRFDS